jgi:3-hydroxybutyryl-CoA dehydrogenase
LNKVGVVGCGLMGAGIAEVVARAGADVVVIESSSVAAAAGRDRVARSLQRAEKRGLLESPEAVFGHISVVTELDALHDSDLVVEAILEDERAKTDLFAALDRIVTSRDAILASNTSSIPIMKLGVVTSRPEHVLGIHFFNLVPVLALVELVPSLLTSPETLECSRDFVEGRLGKHPILCQDRAGFVVNSLLVPFVLSAIRMLESGFASAETSTPAWFGGPRTRWGRLRSPTSSDWIRPRRSRTRCTTSSRNRNTHRRRCSSEW